AVRGDHRVPVDRLVPVAYSNSHLRVAFAARRREPPLVGFTLRNDMFVPRHDYPIGQAFPYPESDYRNLRFDRTTRGPKPERRAHDLHRLARSHERTRYVVEAFRRAAVAAEQVLQDLGAADCLRTAFRVELDVVPTLQPLLHVPIGKAVANVIDDGPWHAFIRLPSSGIHLSRAASRSGTGKARRCQPCMRRAPGASGMRLCRHRSHSLPTMMSGASGCFIPTM